MFRLQTEMIPKIKQFFRSAVRAEATVDPSRKAGLNGVTPVRGKLSPPDILVIGTSTGGPAALAEILPMFPSSYPLPILIVQHMPPLFTRFLSERLDSLCELHVEEASQGAPVVPGNVLIAPGDFHMRLVTGPGGVSVGLDQSAQQNFCRPAVDVLFRSAAEIYGGAVLAVVLTGMGQDGLRGVEVLKARGARVFAQDEPTSVVWGMPGAITNAGLADRVLPLNQMVTEILRASESR
jgi:two-component system chemotaxis response regulator CheB